MRIVEAKWNGFTYRFVATSLEKALSTEVRTTHFDTIISTYETITNAAAIYTDSMATSLILDKLCFIECKAYHGHCFGCYGTKSASYNHSVTLTRIYHNHAHPSYIVHKEKISSDSVNLTNSLKESVFLRSDVHEYVTHCSISNTSTGFYAFALYTQSLIYNNIIIITELVIRTLLFEPITTTLLIVSISIILEAVQRCAEKELLLKN